MDFRVGAMSMHFSSRRVQGCRDTRAEEKHKGPGATARSPSPTRDVGAHSTQRVCQETNARPDDAQDATPDSERSSAPQQRRSGTTGALTQHSIPGYSNSKADIITHYRSGACLPGPLRKKIRSEQKRSEKEICGTQRSRGNKHRSDKKGKRS